MSVSASERPSVLPEGKLLYQCDFPIRWGDMDALGHVNNTVYFRYFEQTRLEWYEQSGFGSLSSKDKSILIVDNHAEYLKPVVYPAHVTIRMGAHSPGRSSFISTYTLAVGDVLYTRASSKVVWVDIKAGKSTPMPEAAREMFASDSDSHE
ncbi:acyl-CoA thioesterase [Granulosicoccus antarcticus]|uniref:Esterase n=1 Tax=Granulosicoccus antarcticus IMCC3135 TaxID=1192854 RepID=A0A2Z2P1I8_9GAMM|nr:thioesterase family protein [Granulosicoccus antarcticus]ASJ76685.1 Putative esterase [Granulosicoccus antarcticus IMCC3135]